MKILKYFLFAFVIYLLGNFVFPLVIQFFHKQNLYLFNRQISNESEFQLAAYLRGRMITEKCDKIGYELNNETFFSAAKLIGYDREKLLNNIDVEKLDKQVNEAIKNNLVINEVSCSSMFKMLVTAIPNSAIYKSVDSTKNNTSVSVEIIQNITASEAIKHLYFANYAVTYCKVKFNQPQVKSISEKFQINMNLIQAKDELQITQPEYKKQWTYVITILKTFKTTNDQCISLLRDYGPNGIIIKNLLVTN